MTGSRQLPSITKVLIIDDNEDTVKLLHHKLEKEGFKIITAMDGSIGLEKARKEEPNLIILDILMRGKNGIQTLADLKKDQIANLIPIIMLSAVKDVSAKVQLLEGGADDYITKPVDFRELLARIHTLLRRTESHVKEKRFSVKLLNHLITKFEKRGYNIYTPLNPSYSKASSKWGGPVPDLFVEKGNKRIAFSMESMEALLAPKTVDRWKSFLSNPDTGLTIIVHSKESQRAARMLKKEYGINARIILEKERKDFKSISARLRIYRYLSTRWIIITAICIFTALLLSLVTGGLPSLWRGAAKSLLSQTSYYEPRDTERQLNELQKQIEQLKK